MMTSRKPRRAGLASAALPALALLTSCGVAVTKGDVYQAVREDIRVGASKAEVKKFVESLEVSGVKPGVGEFEPTSPQFSGSGVRIKTVMAASFRNGFSVNPFDRREVFALFCFDEADRLITYQIDWTG